MWQSSSISRRMRRRAFEERHHSVSQVGKWLRVQDFGEDIGQVLFGVNVRWDHDILVTEYLNPLLTAINMLKLRSLDSPFGKCLSCGIVKTEFEGDRELHTAFIE